MDWQGENTLFSELRKPVLSVLPATSIPSFRKAYSSLRGPALSGNRPAKHRHVPYPDAYAIYCCQEFLRIFSSPIFCSKARIAQPIVLVNTMATSGRYFSAFQPKISVKKGRCKEIKHGYFFWLQLKAINTAII